MKLLPGMMGAAAAALVTAPLAAQMLPVAVETEREMVVTANPLATEAAAEILARGGTATDAMITAQTVLGLVEPQASGIGGGAFIVYYDAEDGELTTFDAREKAPAAATGDRFLNPDGSSGDFLVNWQSGLSVGVPGVPALLEVMHERYGRLPFRKLFKAAEELARDGFAITGRTSDQVDGLLARNASCSDRLFFRDPNAFAYFTNNDPVNCAAKPAGTIQTNPDYARLMRRLARLGAKGFYRGPVARAVVSAVSTDLNIPGDMTLKDLRAYDVIERDPVCIDYRGLEVCGMGPPSSGGLAVGQILGILEHFDLGSDPLDDRAVHLFAQAGRLAFADRNLYVGDSDFVTVPAEGMLDKDYLASRAALITGNDLGTAEPGDPPGEFDPTAPHSRAKDSGTSHISIVDRYGNALSMTTTIESSFGNGVLVPGWGFLLNNELTDFSFQPASADGTPIANRVQPNKRPRSSMSPSILFTRGPGDDDDDEDDDDRDRRDDDDDDDDDDRRVFLVTGSPGGSRIIGYTAQSIINVVDFGLDPQQAINVPHIINRNGTTEIEDPIPGVTLDYDPAALRDVLISTRGYAAVNISDLTSGLSVIQVGDGVLIGGADKRRDGTVGGR